MKGSEMSTLFQMIDPEPHMTGNPSSMLPEEIAAQAIEDTQDHDNDPEEHWMEAFRRAWEIWLENGEPYPFERVADWLVAEFPAEVVDSMAP